MRLLSGIGLGDNELYQEALVQLNKLQPSNFKLCLYEQLGQTLFKIASSNELC